MQTRRRRAHARPGWWPTLLPRGAPAAPPQAALLLRGCRSFACAFGETTLVPGDAWAVLISEAMDRCVLFVALATHTGAAGCTAVDTRKELTYALEARADPRCPWTDPLSADPHSQSVVRVRPEGGERHLRHQDDGRVRRGVHAHAPEAAAARQLAAWAAAACRGG